MLERARQALNFQSRWLDLLQGDATDGKFSQRLILQFKFFAVAVPPDPYKHHGVNAERKNRRRRRGTRRQHTVGIRENDPQRG